MTTPRPKIVVAVNPTAGFGRAAGRGDQVVAALRGAGHRVTLRAAPDLPALEAVLRADLEDGHDTLVVIGGDGMVHLAARLTAGTGIPFGIVPAGTGNDLARGLGIALDPPLASVAALIDALEHPPRTIDALRITDADGRERFAAGVVSAGFDALVNERANRMRRPRGGSRYTLAMLRELVGLRARGYRVELDGEPIERHALLVSAANNGFIGGGMRIVPDARLDDGLLDVFMVTRLGRIGFLRIFPRVFSGRHIGHPAVEVRRGASVRLDAEGIVAYADGERVGPLPVRVDIAPGALRVIAAPPPAAPDAT